MKQLSNYNSFEGVLYCRPHFDQNFKRTGSLEKSFEGKQKQIKMWKLWRVSESLILFCIGTPKIGKPDRPLEGEVNFQTTLFICFLILCFCGSWTFITFDLKNLLQRPAGTKVSNMFGGTREKCVGCDKTVYPIEKVTNQSK